MDLVGPNVHLCDAAIRMIRIGKDQGRGFEEARLDVAPNVRLGFSTGPSTRNVLWASGCGQESDDTYKYLVVRTTYLQIRLRKSRWVVQTAPGSLSFVSLHPEMCLLKDMSDPDDPRKSDAAVLTRGLPSLPITQQGGRLSPDHPSAGTTC